MTDKELRRLGKRELLEILTALRKRLDEVLEENKALREKVELVERKAADETKDMIRRLYEDRFGKYVPVDKAREDDDLEKTEKTEKKE